jgi:hypothetical protein
MLKTIQQIATGYEVEQCLVAGLQAVIAMKEKQHKNS